MAGVSLCMIIKDEAVNLPGCLESVRKLVDEIIIADTGSSDDSKEIAARLGAQVFDFAWVDSFAAARNASIERARGDWIFWLDADERLDESNRTRLTGLFSELPDANVAYLMRQRSHGKDLMVADQARLFRNDPRIRWRHRVHEQVVPAVEAAGGVVRQTDVVIDHTGYTNEAVSRRKTERNLRLLELENRESPGDPFTLFNLGWAYHQLGRTPEALPLWYGALDRVRAGAAIERKLHALLAQGHYQLGHWRKALDAAERGLERYPGDIELLFEESLACYQLGDLSGSERALLQLLGIPADRQVAMMDAGIRSCKARNNLALIYLQQQRYAEAETQLRLLLAESPGDRAAWVGLAELYLLQRRWAELAGALEHIPDPAQSALLLGRAHLAAGELAQAREALERAIAAGPGVVFPHLLLAQVLLREGSDPPAAERALRTVLALDPSNQEARHNLSVLVARQGHRSR